MSNEHLLLIITHWKSEAYDLSRRLKSMQQEYHRQLHQSSNENLPLQSTTQSSSITNANLLEQLLVNADPTSVSNQISVLCDFFAQSLKTLLVSTRTEQRGEAGIKFPPILQSIETNIQQIGNLIEKMNKDCSNQLFHP